MQPGVTLAPLTRVPLFPFPESIATAPDTESPSHRLTNGARTSHDPRVGAVSVTVTQQLFGFANPDAGRNQPTSGAKYAPGDDWVDTTATVLFRFPPASGSVIPMRPRNVS